MIFVTVGTTKFEELVKEIDKIAPKINEKIIIQIGKGEYLPKNCEYFRYKKNLMSILKKSDLVITHGGAGTLFELISLNNKKIIGVNNAQLIDEHQSDLLKKLSDEKHILWCKNIDKLRETIKKSKAFKFKRYIKPKCRLVEKIMDK